MILLLLIAWFVVRFACLFCVCFTFLFMVLRVWGFIDTGLVYYVWRFIGFAVVDVIR